ncbi:hypothetical protein [Imhoffiella purpurea]|uniref:hypothetical protein n=1 Tax=Imhoffiella purpurea TaxID=1249627 RepID=UPI0005C1B92F|nr:hypothetical protein [Imhoffiella purpurea]
MAKGAFFPRNFWDSSIKDELWELPAGHFRVFLHLAYGPTAHLSGLYRISVGAIAEDTGLEPDEVRNAIDTLADIGWCDVEYPLVWIRGAGNILDKLGTTGIEKNPAWVKSTRRHLDDLPPSNRLVELFRRYHGLLREAGGEAPPEAPREAGGEPSSSSCSSSSPYSSFQGAQRTPAPKFREQDENGLDIEEVVS